MNMPDAVHILLVEDDRRFSALVADYLSQQGFKVSIEDRGDTGLKRIIAEQPEFVILDLMLPGLDGLDLCRTARQQHYQGPILILTAREDDMDQVAGLEIGADDYVKKPVEPRILLARIRAVLRRSAPGPVDESAPPPVPERMQFDSLCINRAAQTITLDGEPITLTTHEFALLWELALHAGRPIERDALFRRTRGIPYNGFDRSVDITISRLRKKLGDSSAQPKRIKTIWGQGYLFVKDAWGQTKE